eukprot:scaffold1618_cov80-Skeletonema_dohrnii-CCMP3373.AAC.1
MFSLHWVRCTSSPSSISRNNRGEGEVGWPAGTGMWYAQEEAVQSNPRIVMQLKVVAVQSNPSTITQWKVVSRN